MRKGAVIFTKSSDKVSHVTSGLPAPSLENKEIGMTYMDAPYNKLKTEQLAVVRPMAAVAVVWLLL